MGAHCEREVMGGPRRTRSSSIHLLVETLPCAGWCPPNVLCPSQATHASLQTPNGLADNPGLSLLLNTDRNSTAEGHSAGQCRLQDLNLHLPDLTGSAHFIPHCLHCLGRRVPSLRVSSCFPTFPTQFHDDNSKKRAPPCLAATLFSDGIANSWFGFLSAPQWRGLRMPGRSRK